MSSRRRKRTIRASELSLYGFCHRAWWLATLRGVLPANRAALAEGAVRHQAHASSLSWAVRLRWVGLALLGLGILLALGWWLVSRGM